MEIYRNIDFFSVRRNGHIPTFGLKFDPIFELPVPDFLEDVNFWQFARCLGPFLPNRLLRMRKNGYFSTFGQIF